VVSQFTVCAATPGTARLGVGLPADGTPAPLAPAPPEGVGEPEGLDTGEPGPLGEGCGEPLPDHGREVPVLDLSVEVAVSSGTYVRALARDLGSALGVGGHLTALRRTRIGRFTVAQAKPLAALTEHFAVMPMAKAARIRFDCRVVGPDEAALLSHGHAIPIDPAHPAASGAPVAAIAADGRLVALVEDRPQGSHPVTVFAA
jgi:tRNA U55 pseudouridine synthase TruB